MRGRTDLLESRDIGLSLLSCGAGLLLLGIAALIPVELGMELARMAPWEEDPRWRFGVLAPSGGVALAGGCWAAVALWVVHGTRKEGEPPEAAGNILSVAVAGLVCASLLAAAEIVDVAARLEMWEGARLVGAWLLAGVLLVPWRIVRVLTDDDPGHRLERVWRLHGVSGGLITLGALAPLLVVLSWELRSGSYVGGAPSHLLACLVGIVLLGGCVAGVSAWMRSVAAGLDEQRLGLADLPPQPSRGWLTRSVPLLGSLTLLASVLMAVPWPEAKALQRRLTEAGLVSPQDGRMHWLVLEERVYRKLVSAGEVRVDVAPTGAHLTATVDGDNPGFWVLWEKLSWYPQQLRDLWNITEVAFSEDGEQMLVGRQRGLLQVREFPSGRVRLGWAEHHWDPVWSRSGRVFFDQGVAYAVNGDGRLRSRSPEEGWVERHLFEGPLQGVVVSGDGTRLATLSRSHRVRIFATEDYRLLAEHSVRGARELIWRGESLLVAGQGVWLLEPGARVRQLMDGPVRDAALSPDQEKLAVASSGVGVLGLDDGAWLLPETALMRGGAASVSWRPSGEMLVVGSTAGTLEMWLLTEHRWD